LKGEASCELKEKRKNSSRGRKKIHSGRRRDMLSGYTSNRLALQKDFKNRERGKKVKKARKGKRDSVFLALNCFSSRDP